MKKDITVLLVDDNEIVRSGLRHMLDMEEGLRVVGDCGCADEVFAQVGMLSPDIILMDVQMPGVDGVEATRRLKHNGFSCHASVIILAESGDYLINALEAGAAGYLLKETKGDALAQTVRQVYLNEHLPQQDDSVVEEVELSIPLLTDAGQLVKFVGQVEDALHATVVQTVGSWEWGTDITIAVQPTPLENILGRLKSMIDVETVEDGPDARCDPGILKRFKGLLGGRELPPKRLLVTLKQAGMPDMSCQGLAMALN